MRKRYPREQDLPGNWDKIDGRAAPTIENHLYKRSLVRSINYKYTKVQSTFASLFGGTKILDLASSPTATHKTNKGIKTQRKDGLQ
jgi:hypothetical protein